MLWVKFQYPGLVQTNGVLHTVEASTFMLSCVGSILWPDAYQMLRCHWHSGGLRYLLYVDCMLTTAHGKSTEPVLAELSWEGWELHHP